MSGSYKRYVKKTYNRKSKTDKRLAAKAVRRYQSGIQEGSTYKKLYSRYSIFSREDRRYWSDTRYVSNFISYVENKDHPKVFRRYGCNYIFT